MSGPGKVATSLRAGGATCAILALVALMGAACGPRREGAGPAPATARADPDFLAPPALTSADRDPAGGVRLIGRAQPGARVRLRSPDGAAFDTVAGEDGGWTAVLPDDPGPRVFALTAEPADAPGRVVRGEGALLVPPPPGPPAVLMRGGAPAWPVSGPGPGVSEGLRWSTLDVDAGGGAAASGFAPPGTPVRLAVDGAASGAAEADADAAGRFGLLWLGDPIAAGEHALTLATPRGALTLRVPLTPPAPLAGAPARFTRAAQGWRIDWTPPGGGVQTTWVLDPAALSPAPLRPGPSR